MEEHPQIGSDKWFLSGLVAFLIGHVFFMFAMSARSYELLSSGISNDGYAIKGAVSLFVVFMIKTLIPGIKDDVLKVGVVIYAFVIGRMLFWALISTTQENELLMKLKLALKKDPKTNK